MKQKEYHFEDFTQENYRRLLALACEERRFVSLHEAWDAPDICHWRHDIDLSPLRALALAQIEAKQGVQAIYYVYLHSMFYSFWERETLDTLRFISRLGHEIGLHFETAFYQKDSPSVRSLERNLAEEAEVLSRVLELDIRSFTIHNPESGDPLLEQEDVAGLVNGFGPALRERFEYCSDSNGYWRYQRLEEVLRAPVLRPLNVLTHPVWWTEEVMAPRDRVARCIEGRGLRVASVYDTGIEAHQRRNVRGDP
jgi:hypothetical protein